MTDRDLYEVLGVPRDASKDDIRRAFKKLARRYHPDVNPDDATAEERFKEAAFAHEVLSDDEQRSRYDRFGKQGLGGAGGEGFSGHGFGGHGGFDFGGGLDDLLRNFFGGNRGPARGRDREADVRVDFLDAVLAREIRIPVDGTTLRVRVPPGAETGTRVRLGGKGEPGASGGPPGDLYLTLQVGNHRWFERNGDDLDIDVPVTLPELIRGARIEVPTPDGQITMSVPPRSNNGQRLRVRGKGAVRDSAGVRGDLYVRLVARLPDAPDASAEQLEQVADQLEALYADADVRKALRGS